MNRFEKSLRQKRTSTLGNTRRSLISFGLMTSSHEQKRTLFFYLSVRHAHFKVLFFHQFGRPWAQNIGLLTPTIYFLIFLNFGWKRENLKKKWKKRFFGWAKTGKHGYFCTTPTGLPDDFSWFYYFFLLEDMSVMCLSLLTNSVGLKGKELEFFPNW